MPEKCGEVRWKYSVHDFITHFKILALRSGHVFKYFNRDVKAIDTFKKLHLTILMNYIVLYSVLTSMERKAYHIIPHTLGGQSLVLLGCTLILGYNILSELSSYWSTHHSLDNIAVHNAN